MPRKQQTLCKRGHQLAQAHVTMTPRGIKRTCKICRRIRQSQYVRSNKPASPKPPTQS